MDILADEEPESDDDWRLGEARMRGRFGDPSLRARSRSALLRNSAGDVVAAVLCPPLFSTPRTARFQELDSDKWAQMLELENVPGPSVETSGEFVTRDARCETCELTD